MEPKMGEDKCICKICICGRHRCDGRALKNNVWQSSFEAPENKTETQVAYCERRPLSSIKMFTPLEGDWYLKNPVQPRPVAQSHPEEVENELDEDEIATFVRAAREEDDEPLAPYPCGKFEVKDYGLPPAEKFVSRLPKEPPHLPSLLDKTVYKISYGMPVPVIQLPSYAWKYEKKYERPTIAMNDKTNYGRDFVEWDLKGGLTAPLPFDYDVCGKVVPKNNLKPYKVPFAYLTTTRDDYSGPLFETRRVKLVLEDDNWDCERKQAELERTCRCGQLLVCERHSYPAEKFAIGRIYRTTHMNDYRPPHNFPPKQPKRKCPALALSTKCGSTEYEFSGTCYGHKLFRKRINIYTI